MTEKSFRPPSLPGLGSVRRRQVVADPAEAVTCKLLNGAAPAVIQPRTADLDLAAWAASARELVAGWFAEHRALLFRGFPISDIHQFQRLVEATSVGEPLEYKDRSTPRPRVGEGVYVSTVYPSERTIALHNEGTYWTSFPQKIYFGALQVADTGGETPIADVRRVPDHLPMGVRKRFDDLGVLYVRNYNDGLGLPWEEVFQTSDRSEVEAYCESHDIEYEWKGEDRLRTRQRRPALRQHPETGEAIWFNHAAFFHVSSLEPEMRQTLLDDLGEEGLPYNTYYGDGSVIEPEVAEIIRRAYRQETVAFPWQPGDVMLLDNLCFAHGRRPYTGERQVVVAMMEPVAG
ncbi:MAG: TauD/TfdA family dioxygenase [Acidobacteriota bacterium]